MISLDRKTLYRLLPPGLLLVVLFSFVLAYNLFDVAHFGNQHFSELAKAFWHGQFYFLDNSLYNQLVSDVVPFGGHFYWSLGPLPAILLMPFVAVGNLFNFYFLQSYLNLVLVASVAYLVFKMARRLNFSVSESLYWLMAFVFGSMFFGVALIGYSWYFAQTITVFLLFLALFEYFGRKRYFVIGLVMGLVLLTRVTAFLGILFFIVDLVSDQKISSTLRIKNLGRLAVIPALCLLLLFGYNQLRFGNFLDQGYRAQHLPPGFMFDKASYGLFNLKYLPRGIYFSLLNLPRPVYSSATHLLKYPFVGADLWGMSIFATSPYLLYLFFIKLKNRKTILLLAASALVWLTIVSSFFIGYTQFGFRYALDFLPLLFTALMVAYKNTREGMSLNLQLIIMASALFNLYLLFNLLPEI